MILIKYIHISCAIISISGFLARSWLRITAPQALQQRWIKITPHVIDSLLLLSAIALVLLTRQYPWTTPWITAKLLALIVYIGFGLLTLRFARTRGGIFTGLVGACLSFSYIITVALTHQAWPIN